MARNTKKSKPVGTPLRGVRYPVHPERLIHPDHPANPLDGIAMEDTALPADSGSAGVSPAVVPRGVGVSPAHPIHYPLTPIYRDDSHGIWLYHGNCLTILDAVTARYPEGRFDMIAEKLMHFH